MQSTAGPFDVQGVEWPMSGVQERKTKKMKQEMSNFEHRPVANLQDRGIKQKYNEKFALAVRVSFVKDVSKRSLQPRRCFHGDMIYRFNWQQ